jgi:RNA polymerase sigma-70 factor (ECF subfamily)
MKYQDDFSIKEIADTLKITESAVKMRLLRSKEKLKKLYLENMVVFALIVLKLIFFWKK